MVARFTLPKLILGTVVIVMTLLFAVIGVQSIWKEYVAKDYSAYFTEQVYVDTVVNTNVNMVFYRKGCPYCEKAKQGVISAAEKSSYPTFYINVQSEAGQLLVKKYQVEKAATLITIREGKSKLYLYATKDKKGKIIADEKNIKEALNDTEN